MKIIGILMILLSSALCGLFAAKRVAENTARLCAIELMLLEIETQINFCAKNLIHIFMDLKTQNRFDSLQFLKFLDLNNTESFSKCWLKAIDDDSALSDEEKTVLSSLSDTLGSTDISGQTSALRLAKHRFSQMLETARQNNPQKMRLYMSMGVLCGAAIAVMMI